MTTDDRYKLIIDWTQRFSGLPLVIKDRMGGPRPEGAYGMVNILAADQLYELPSDIEVVDLLNPTDEPVELVPVMEWEYTVSFNVYARDAVEYAQKVISAGSTQAGLETLGPLTLARNSPIRRVPEWIDNRWEDRVQVDLFFHSVERRGIPGDLIDVVPVTATNLEPEPRTLAHRNVARPDEP